MLPCKFHRAIGCSKGVDCAMCHYEHPELSVTAIRRMATNLVKESAAKGDTSVSHREPHERNANIIRRPLLPRWQRTPGGRRMSPIVSKRRKRERSESLLIVFQTASIANRNRASLTMMCATLDQCVIASHRGLVRCLTK